jgi:hypothetical protein
MKAELFYEEHGWVFYISSQNETEKCALQYLGDRPLNNFHGVHIEYIGAWFRPEDRNKEGKDASK